jgi:hypothetical protein
VTIEAWAAAATIGTFVVIAITAVAALVQLRHLRSSNQLQAIIDLGHQIVSIAEPISFVYRDLPAKMKNAKFRQEIGGVIDLKSHPELLVAIRLDEFGLLLRLGLVDERFGMEFGAGAAGIVQAWKNLEGVIAIRRRVLPLAYQNFEYFASRAQKWLERHPEGTYPASEPRLPVVDRWAVAKQPGGRKPKRTARSK